MGYSGLLLPSSKPTVLVVAFSGLRVFFIGVWSITLLLEHLFVVFLFLEGAWSNNFDFWFHWILSRCPLWTTWGPGASIAPPFPWGSYSRLLGASLVFPCLNSVRFTLLAFFVRGFAPSSMGVIGHAFLECPWCSLARFQRTSWDLPCALSHISSSLGKSYFTGELHGLSNRLVRAFLFWKR